MSTPEERVAEAFNVRFATFEITLEPGDVVVGTHREIVKRGWRITYRVDPDDAGYPSLELYVVHRMTDDSHSACGRTVTSSPSRRSRRSTDTTRRSLARRRQPSGNTSNATDRSNGTFESVAS